MRVSRMKRSRDGSREAPTRQAARCLFILFILKIKEKVKIDFEEEIGQRIEISWVEVSLKN